MRKLAVTIFGLMPLAACGGSSATPDAAIVKIIDAKPIDGAPPIDSTVVVVDAKQYDLTCLGMAEPTTAADPITIAGSTQEITTQGVAVLAGVSVSAFKTGTATALSTVTSDGTGVFTTGNLATGGAPLPGFASGTKTGYRGTFLYPPAPLAKSLANAPVIMITPSTFGTLSGFAGFTQNDDTNGALFIAVTDCANVPISGATLSVKQGATDVGTMQVDLGAFSAQAAGTFFVFNVPDGATDVTATYDGHTFPVHTIQSHKKNVDTLPNGALTITIVRPGPLLP